MTTRFGGLFLTAALSALCAASLNSARAEEISIVDTTGTVRAQGELDGAAAGDVTMTVTDTATGEAVADGTVVTLTPVGGGAAISGISSGGQVIFSALPAGTYTVASSSAVTFTSVGITTGTVVLGAGAAGSTALVVGGLAGAGGITAIAVNNNDSKKNDPLSPAS